MSATILQFTRTQPLDARSRIKARRERLGLAAPEGIVGAVGCGLMRYDGDVVGVVTNVSIGFGDLTMDHADPCNIPCFSAYSAPVADGA